MSTTESAAVKPIKPPVNADMIEYLKKLVKEAEEGTLKGVGVYADYGSTYDVISVGMKDRIQAIGAYTVAAQRLGDPT